MLAEVETILVECALIEEGGGVQPLALYAFWITLTIYDAIFLEEASLPLFPRDNK